MSWTALIPPLLALGFAPLLPGIINRTQAKFAGRDGPPLRQAYFDLWKLLHKGAVYSPTTSWVFRAGPVLGLAAVMTALAVAPWGGFPALAGFRGDWVFLAGLLGLMRFLAVLAALDTGSSCEGMGASRAIHFSALAEPALFLALAVVARKTGPYSLAEMFASLSPWHWVQSGSALALAAGALFIVCLAENSRLPVDDPGTHLEPAMIHEAMVLDHGGPDLAFILYGAALKLWVLGSVLVSLVFPVHPGPWWADALLALGGMLVLAVVIGVVESVMARLRMLMVPQLLVGATALGVVALLLIAR